MNDHPTFSSTQFTWFGSKGVAEISDLVFPLRLEMWEKAFTIQSSKTGEFKPFFFIGVERDAEGEIEAWVFEDASGLIIIKLLND